MGLLDFFRRKPRPPLLLEAHGSRSIGSAIRESWGYTPLSANAAALTRTFGKRPWLHVAVNRRAEAFANVQWVLFRTRNEESIRAVFRRHAQEHAWEYGGQPTRAAATQALVAAGRIEQVHDHKLLDLIEQPGQGIPGRALWELVSQWIDLTGEAFIGIERNKRGRATELVGVAPTFVDRVPTYDNPTFGVRTIRGIIDVPKENMIWIRKMNPSDPYCGRGVGTAAALSDELETDEAASIATKSRFQNRSMPDYVMGFEDLGEDEVARLEQEFGDKNRGPSRAGRVHFVGGGLKQVIPMGHTAVESQALQTREFMRDTTLQTFGMPPEIAGVLENSNKSTIAAAKAHFAEFSTIPMLDRVQSMLQMDLVPSFGRGYMLGYVSPMPEDRESKQKYFVALPSAFKKNEIRAAAGEPPVGDDEGGSDFMPSHGGAPPIPIEGDVPQDVPEPKKKTGDDDRTLRVIVGDALRGER